MWLPRDEVLYIIVKKEAKRHFNLENASKYTEENYKKVIEIVKVQLEKYR